MRCSTRFLCLALWAAVAVAATAQESTDSSAGDQAVGLRAELRQLVGEARDRVFPSLVSIDVVTVQYRGGKELKGRATGSGTIFDTAGHVLTNAHVTQGGEKFVCTLSDQRRGRCVLVGEDPLTDLAVLRLELDEPGNLPVAAFGRSAELEIGDVVLAMGSPFSLSRSVSLGIVSNTERVFGGGFGSDDLEEMELERGQRTGLFTRWIQHDALISPGNSGGPLVNLVGEVVGVNELGGGALSFAIPSDLAARVLATLIAEGRVQRSWLGLAFQPARAAGLDRGALVSSVTEDGPAARAGVQAGDVLLAVDGDDVDARFVEQVPLLLDRLASRPVGSRVVLTVESGGKTADREVVTEELADDLGAQESFHAWGLTAQDITAKMARDLALPSAEGVLVTGVRRGGPAQQASPPIQAGSVLRAVAGRPTPDLSALVALYGELDTVGDAEDLVVELERRGEHRLTLLEPTRDRPDDPPRELPKAWIAVAAQPVLPPLAAEMGWSVERGLRVTRVYPETAAERAGLEVGDVLLSVAGEPLRPDSAADASLLSQRVRGLEIGSTVPLELLRDGETLTLEVLLERTRLTPDQARRSTDRDFELTVRELTFFDRDARRWSPDRRGVLVENVESGGWAGLGGLRPGDLVLRVGDHEVRGLRSFREALDAARVARSDRVVVVVLRGVRTHFRFLEPDWAPVD
ncbi:MAG: PDZ domain-containing protein [Acidobacteriota bacterium]